jgi:putative GTP pyrophosphokinase
MSDLETAYRERHDTVLVPLARNLESFLASILAREPRIDRISARAKSIDRFLGKAAAMVDDRPKYTEPLEQIQDQVGARIITFYKDDVPRVVDAVSNYFRSIESRAMLPDREWEFGYFGHHSILLLPKDVVEPDWDHDLVPSFFELQVKTLFEHAWSEANHDLGYKPGQMPLSTDEARQLAFTSAQAWGADRVFNELFLNRRGTTPQD